MQGTDDPADPSTDRARSMHGAAFAPLVVGVVASESGTGSVRTVEVEVRDLSTTGEAL